MMIGVLALQGDFAEHINILQHIGVEACEVRLPEQLVGLDGLIMPGGESTTIGKLATSYNLIEPLRRFSENHALWGTCAGAIFLAKDAHRSQPLLELMDITVDRNAFGRQVESFEVDLEIPVLEDPQRPFRAIFIRAPIIESVGDGVEVIARLNENLSSRSETIVAARQGRLLATSFHPELIDDSRFHRYFLSLVKAR
jgi:5'-phosphate synthase pdxT subunit